MEKDIKKILKLAKYSPEVLAEALKFLNEDEEEVVEEVVEEVQEEVVETKVEDKEESQSDTVTLSKKDLEDLLAKYASNFVKKEELDVVKKDVDTTVKKAQPFGVESKTPAVKTENKVKTAQDWANELNQKQY